MEKPVYAIGRDEMLIITVKWTAGVNKGLVNILETEFHVYTEAEVQKIIDEVVSDHCDVIGVDLYDFRTKRGQSIAHDFDVRTWAEREEDARQEQAEDDERSVRVAYNAMRNSFQRLPVSHLAAAE